MDGSHIVQLTMGAFAGGTLTGISAYVAFAKSLTKLESRVKECEKDHDECKSTMGESLKELTKSVALHHESGAHITQDYKDLLQKQFEIIEKQLEDISKQLKNGSSPK